jgi:hypothetical protein
MRYIAWVLEIKFNGGWVPTLLIFAGMLARGNHVADFAATNKLNIDDVRLRRIRQRAVFVPMLERFRPEKYPTPIQVSVAQRTLWSKLPNDGDSVQLDDSLFTKAGRRFVEVAV